MLQKIKLLLLFTIVFILQDIDLKASDKDSSLLTSIDDAIIDTLKELQRDVQEHNQVCFDAELTITQQSIIDPEIIFYILSRTFKMPRTASASFMKKCERYSKILQLRPCHIPCIYHSTVLDRSHARPNRKKSSEPLSNFVHYYDTL